MKKSQKKLEQGDDEEMDGREQGIESQEATNLASWQVKAEQDPSDPRKRPTDIILRQISSMEAVVTTASSISSEISTSTSDTNCYVQKSGSSSSDDFIHVSLPIQPSDDSSKLSQERSRPPQTQSNPTLPKLSETEESPSLPRIFSTGTQFTDGEDFFTINEMHMCICGQWLCVSNIGGVVMAFDFGLKNTEKKEPKVRTIIPYTF